MTQTLETKIAPDVAGTVPLELTVVVPVFREADNVAMIVARLDAALAGLGWEVVFVDDDSPDGTADRVRAIAATDRRVRIIQRIGRRGLSSACIEGMCAAAAPHVAVMDGDGQHDETILPALVERLRLGADVAVGSRFVSGGGTGAWDSDRVAKSALATRLARRIAPVDTTDPMSGFFAVRTDLVRTLVPRLSGVGFKILLDLLTASKTRLAVADVGYVFRTREVGESKLDHVVALEYLLSLGSRALGDVVPIRLVLFGMVGTVGLAVHLAALLALSCTGMAFLPAMALAVLAAMTGNFLLNNTLTYREKRLRGARALMRGWVSFAAVCSVGSLANLAAAQWLHSDGYGWLLPALAGSAAGIVWNYALSSRFVWGRYR